MGCSFNWSSSGTMDTVLSPVVLFLWLMSFEEYSVSFDQIADHDSTEWTTKLANNGSNHVRPTLLWQWAWWAVSWVSSPSFHLGWSRTSSAANALSSSPMLDSPSRRWLTVGHAFLTPANVVVKNNHPLPKIYLLFKLGSIYSTKRFTRIIIWYSCTTGTTDEKYLKRQHMKPAKRGDESKGSVCRWWDDLLYSEPKIEVEHETRVQWRLYLSEGDSYSSRFLWYPGDLDFKRNLIGNLTLI